jgi:predicted permease
MNVGLISDLRFGARQLRKARSFTFAAVTTIAVSISLNTTAFAIVEAVLLRPLPYPHPEQLADLVTTYTTATAAGFEDSQDGTVWEMATERVDAVDWASYSSLSSGVTLVAGAPRHVQQERVSAQFFQVLGIQPILGRTFTREEDRDGGPAAAVLSYRLWNSTFNGDPAAVGRSVMLRGEQYTVVGVMPREFRTTIDAELWTALRPSTLGEGQGQNYGVIVRLKPGRTWPEADAQVAAISDEALRHFRPSPDAHARLRLLPLQQVLTDPERKPLLMLWAAVVLVFVIGIVNTAGLLLARGIARRHEFATRRALGASSWAIVRQLMSEAFILASVGASAGLLLSTVTLNAVAHLLTGTFGVWQTVTIDAHVLMVTVILSTGITLAIALLPAWHLTRGGPGTTIVTGGRVAGPAQRWPRQLLVMSEIALTMALVVVTAVLIRSFAHLRLLNPGFDGSDVIASSVSLQDARYTSASDVVALFDRTLARARQLPRVQNVAVAGSLPYKRALNLGFRRLDGPDAPTAGALTTFTYVTPGFFDTLAIPVRRGRAILEIDTPNSEKVVVVNEAFVGRYLRDQDPVRSHVAVAGDTRTIVGVVGDVQQTGWNSPIAPLPAIYAPAAQLSDGFFRMAHVWFAPHWLVKTAWSPAQTEHALKVALAEIDPNLVFAPFQPLGNERGKALALQRAEAALLSGFAAVALGLCAIAAYAMVANMVAERRREFGIRLALGASRWQSVLRVAAPAIVLALAGTCVGALTARAVATLLRGLVWGIRADDSMAFSVAALTIVAVSASASVVPALQIASLDPAATLRSE